jgi:hypothetical protein
MDAVQKMLSISLDFPREVVEQAERSASSLKQCVGYLQAVENAIVLRVFAFRKLKKKAMQITEIMRRITQDKHFAYKNLYGGYGEGYHVVYEEKDVLGSYGYKRFDKEDFDAWCIYNGAPFGIWYNLLNADMLKDTQYKYCGFGDRLSDDVIDYLNAYIEHPSVEYFGKMGIKPSATLVRKAEKDKAFRSWLYKNGKEVEHYGPKAALYAYQHHIGVGEACAIVREKDYIDRRVAGAIPEIKGTKLDRKKVHDYAFNANVGSHNYNDYLKALKALKYDLEDTKNVFPHDFKRMHDIRIAEYQSVMAKEDAEKRKELYAQFEEKAQKAKKFEYQGESYAVIVPSNIPELVREGEALSHCVGRMGYDKKMADGEIVIVFVRSILEMAKPLVTVEYDLKRKMVRQAHGWGNRMPTTEEQTFIDEWAEKTTQNLKGK